ncbi:MAG: HNH endonuclease [Oscillospiraceae bacterium]|nr:HNH endonuclease [Oscillospiraceae bacterium]
MVFEKKKLQDYAQAFIMYEIAAHGIDPRKSLDGTTFRIEELEGYKYSEYDTFRKKKQDGQPYVEKIMEALSITNLADYHHRYNIPKILNKKDPQAFEKGLDGLFEGQDDQKSFEEIMVAIGGSFDVLGFIFFLKDCEKYLPIRSRLFNERFRLLGLDSDLEGNCTWSKYSEYMNWMKEIHGYLAKNVNSKITLIDTHSFVWILPYLDQYLKQKVQLVEHKSFGKGTVVGFKNDLIRIKFGKTERTFEREAAFRDGFVKFISIDFSEVKTGFHVLNDIEKEVVEALLQVISEKRGTITYLELSNMTNSKPDPHTKLPKMLDNINRLCDVIGLPYISAMVINKKGGLPGPGFRELCVNTFGYDKSLKTQEIFDSEMKKIANCSEWGRLASYLNLRVQHFERNKADKQPMNSSVLQPENPEQKFTVPTIESMITPPPEYLKDNIHVFSVDSPTPFRLEVDVLNYGFGEKYLGKTYKGLQSGSQKFKSNGTDYLVWFPKISADGVTAASSSGWINVIADDGNTITEKLSSGGYLKKIVITDSIRLVFAQFPPQKPYLFVGVFVPDYEHSTETIHKFNKVANVADFSGAAPQIHYFKKDDEADEKLISELKAEDLTGAPEMFQYNGIAKEKPPKVEIAGRMSPPRDRQIAINALCHAQFCCEYDKNHPTFLRRNSGKPYTEPHHLVPMAFSDDFDVSLDVEENIVSLCSNCHNQIHYGQGADELLRKLFSERQEALKSVGIDITLDQLLKYYQ